MALMFLHAGHHLDADTVLRWWTWDPFTVFLIVLSAILDSSGRRLPESVRQLRRGLRQQP